MLPALPFCLPSLFHPRQHHLNRPALFFDPLRDDALGVEGGLDGLQVDGVLPVVPALYDLCGAKFHPAQQFRGVLSACTAVFGGFRLDAKGRKLGDDTFMVFSGAR